MGALGAHVVGAITEKDCSARSALLKAYVVNSHVEPIDKCNHMQEKMLFYQVDIVI